MARKNKHKQRHQRRPKKGHTEGSKDHHRSKDDRGSRDDRPHTGAQHRHDAGRPARPGQSGFAIRDRSGRVHQIGAGAKAERGPSAPNAAPESPQARTRTPWQERSQDDRPTRLRRPSASGHGEDKRHHGGGSGKSGKYGKPERNFGRKKSGHQEKDSHGGGKRFSRDASHAPHQRGKKDFDQKKTRRYERKPNAGPAAAGGTKLRATIDKNRKGFAFLIFDGDDYEDAFLPPNQAEAFFHGDRVQVRCDRVGNVLDIEVLEHRFRELVGRYSPHPGGPKNKGGWVVYERKRAREEVFMPEGAAGARAGDWIQVRLVFHETGPFTVTAELLQVFGPDLPASADIGMIAAEYNLIEAHPKGAEAEAGQHKLDLNDPHRKDLRSVPFITIDGETARDFDDAIFVETSGSGYVLWVAIADVSHYVTEGSELDKSARSRGTSVYFAERAFHMLPRALSENLCSLRPKEPRLTLVARMEYDRQGKRHRTEVMEALIESKRRATYNEIQKEWEQNKKNPDWEYAAHFALYQIIRKTRSTRGSLDFDLPEAYVEVAPDGEPTAIGNRMRFDAHRLIEEFMIAANEAVTEWIMEKGWPFIYRIHDEPAEKSLERFSKLASNVGVNVAFTGENLHQTLSDLVRRLETHPASAMLNMALLRSMKQAIYSSTHGIHFGLASEAYTHFTSPIRRYPDLIVHRILRHALKVDQKRESAPGAGDFKKLEEELEEIAQHCSYRERLASDAERESIKLKQVRMMMKHLGEEFDAKVVGMADAGLFAQIAEPYVEGLISKDSMTDDFYQFNEDKMIFHGSRKKRIFRVGDRLKVRVVRADIDRRQIDFQLLEHTRSVSPPAQHPAKSAALTRRARA